MEKSIKPNKFNESMHKLHIKIKIYERMNAEEKRAYLYKLQPRIK